MRAVLFAEFIMTVQIKADKKELYCLDVNVVKYVQVLWSFPYINMFGV